MAAMPALATKYTDETYGQFKNCPFSNPKVEECVAGITTGGASGGFFQYGKVEVPLSKSITLQGGVFGDETAPGAEPSALGFIAPNNGAESVVSPELPVRRGLNLITAEVQKDAEWPQPLIESFKEAVKNKETGMFVKIEVAGNGLYENPNALNTEHLLEGEKSAFELPLKTKITGPWLTKLGGGPCRIGNDENPIEQELTTSGAGNAGHVTLNKTFTVAEISGSRLVDFNWPVEEGAQAKGCGGSYESYVDKALEEITRYATRSRPPSGFTVLQGNLFVGEASAVQKALEEGKK